MAEIIRKRIMTIILALAVIACVKTGTISARSKTALAPTDNISRTEVAAVIRRLLQRSELI